MNILYVVPYVPSLIRVRSYNLIRHLSALGHCVTVATLWSTDRDQVDLERLRGICSEVHAVYLPVWRSLSNCVRALPGSEPLQAVYSLSPDLLSRVVNLKRKADVVHVEHLRGARYGVCSKLQDPLSKTPVVWDSVDCISHLFEQAVCSRGDSLGRMINRLELSRTRRYEGWLLRQFDRVVITSDIDRQAMIRLVEGLWQNEPQRMPNTAQTIASPISDRLISVLPNGVDLDYFTPVSLRRESESLTFSGKMSYHANVSAVMHLITNIMPAIWAKRPNACLTVVGQEPPKKIHALAARYAPLVRVTGTVPDIRPFLRQASIAVVPLVYGAGCQNKVLEAMACATPVVATPQAVSSLKVHPGRDVVVTQEPKPFAEAVIRLLGNPRERREVGQAGLRYVETHHRWEKIAGQLETIYDEVITARNNAGSKTVPSRDSQGYSSAINPEVLAPALKS